MRVAAAALNFNDIDRCRGKLVSVTKQPPFTLGMDVCGVVTGAGAGAERWIGRRVVGISKDALGGIAEYCREGADRQRRMVVALAQMRRNHMLQSAAIDLPQQSRCRAILEMTETAGDPPLQ